MYPKSKKSSGLSTNAHRSGGCYCKFFLFHSLIGLLLWANLLIGLLVRCYGSLFVLPTAAYNPLSLRAKRRTIKRVILVSVCLQIHQKLSTAHQKWLRAQFKMVRSIATTYVVARRSKLSIATTYVVAIKRKLSILYCRDTPILPLWSLISWQLLSWQSYIVAIAYCGNAQHPYESGEELKTPLRYSTNSSVTPSCATLRYAP
jgi:hypothetical protein